MFQLFIRFRFPGCRGLVLVHGQAKIGKNRIANKTISRESVERLEWEREWDCNKKMKEWLILNELTTEEALNQLESEVKQEVRLAKQKAWDKYYLPIKEKVQEAIQLAQTNLGETDLAIITPLCNELISNKEPLKRDIFRTVSLVLELLPQHPNAKLIEQFLNDYHAAEAPAYAKDLYDEGPSVALALPVVLFPEEVV